MVISAQTQEYLYLAVDNITWWGRKKKLNSLVHRPCITCQGPCYWIRPDLKNMGGLAALLRKIWLSSTDLTSLKNIVISVKTKGAWHKRHFVFIGSPFFPLCPISEARNPKKFLSLDPSKSPPYCLVRSCITQGRVRFLLQLW